jgi:hypothetical protein
MLPGQQQQIAIISKFCLCYQDAACLRHSHATILATEPLFKHRTVIRAVAPLRSFSREKKNKNTTIYRIRVSVSSLPILHRKFSPSPGERRRQGHGVGL